MTSRNMQYRICEGTHIVAHFFWSDKSCFTIIILVCVYITEWITIKSLLHMIIFYYQDSL